MQRDLGSFPIPPAHKAKLQSAGMILVEDICNLKPSEISKETGLSREESLEILKVIRANNGSGSSSKTESSSRTMSAMEMLQDASSQQTIITFSEQIDVMLGGGIPLTKITEFAGAPGIGKTQMCFQLAIDVQIPEIFGGLGGEAIFIDTEGSFIVERLVDIAQATIDHCTHVANMEESKEQKKVLETFTLDSLLAGVHYYRCQDYIQLIALTHILPDFLKEHPKVRLIIIDSIAFHFRHDFDDYSLRMRLLNGIAQSLIRMASDFSLAVVLTNQMTTKISKTASEPSYLIPALGESWGHAPTIRVILFWENSQRYALLYKSPSKQETTVPYQVTTAGIRDVQTDRHANKDTIVEQPKKRPRMDN